MFKFKNLFLILMVAVIAVIAVSCKEIPSGPVLDPNIETKGVYERVYPITTGDMRVEVSIYPTEKGGVTILTTQISENKFEFKIGYILKPNYPGGVPYQIKVYDLRVQTRERVSVGKNIYLNGKLLNAVFVIGEMELAKFRIDQNGVVYDAFD